LIFITIRLSISEHQRHQQCKRHPFRSHSQSSILHAPSSLFCPQFSILSSHVRFIFTLPIVFHQCNLECACPHFIHQHHSNIISVALFSKTMFLHDFLDLFDFSNMFVTLWMLKST
jgi:hypothetical protein